MAHGITKTDSIVLSRQPAWHGLGQVLPDGATWAHVEQCLGWRVGLEPLYFGSLQERLPKEMGQVVVRQDTQEPLGVVGARYECIQNLDAFECVKPLVEEGTLEVESCGSLFGGKKVWLLCRVNRPEDFVCKGDSIKSYLLVSTSHDGSAALQVGFTAVRVVCNNTLSLARKEGKKTFTSIRHTKSANAAVATLRKALCEGERALISTLEVYKRLKEVRLSMKAAREFLVSLRKKEQEESTEVASELLLDAVVQASEALELTKEEERILVLCKQGAGAQLDYDYTTDTVSAWQLYNAANEYRCHEAGRSAESRFEGMLLGGSGAQKDAAFLEALITATEQQG